MYGNVDADLLWLILLAKYLINECNPKIGKTDSFIFYKKDDIGRLELVMSVHVDDVFMAGNRDSLEKIKQKFKHNLHIQDYGKVKKFLRVYYEWGRDAKGLYEKTTTEKDVKKLVEGYDKNTWGEVKVQKTPGTPGTTPSKSELEEPQDISNYR